MSQPPLRISAIITTYNRAGYVAEAIDCILSQAGRDCELIVVDDGSTDSTDSVLAAYGDRIRRRRIAHGGPAVARNAGMEVARGEYICFLDSDDRCHPARLGLQAAVLDAFPDVAWVSSEISAFDDRGRWEERHLRDYHEPAFRRKGITFEQLYSESTPISYIPGVDRVAAVDPMWSERRLYQGAIYDVYLFELVVFAVSIMFRRALLAQTGMQNPRLEYFEEYEFALRLCRGRRVAFLDVPLYHHRYHPGQMSTRTGARAQWIAIRKQQDLLHVLRMHALRDRGYYDAQRERVDRQLARLCRAVALPLIAFQAGTPHQRRYFVLRARTYLRVAARHGYPQRVLWTSTYMPRPVRRLLVEMDSLLWRSRGKRPPR